MILYLFPSGSIHTLGAVVGCLLALPMMRLLGRRGAALYVMSLSYLLGYILIGTALNVVMIVTGIPPGMETFEL